MKHIVTLTYILSITATSQQTQAFEKISILTDHRPPFEFKNDNGEIVGVAADKVKCILNAMNANFSLEITPWKRAQAETKEGNADAFFAASKNSSRDEYAVLTATIADQYWNWYLSKDSQLDPNDEGFKSKAITGSWSGSNSLKWLKKNGYNAKYNARTTEQLSKMLESKRMDAIFGSNFAIEADLKKLKILDKIKIVKGIHKPMGMYISKNYLSKNNGFLEKFNNTATSSCK
ncbi:substrate-binding periplasmic protein [Spartinivicinus ruber]|uniref:substrate-binding periplasmic protein n=1 Tax=Spartinivicinus ruber TaxID=2683272 RepID=UPI0013D3243B|nr:transporter substrate-binding domain-containing protein [Spartinivicinus ruber]